MKKAAFFLVSLLAFAFAAHAQGIEIGAKMDDFTLSGIDGKSYSLNSMKGEKGAVVIFLSAQCPVVKGYIERINAVAADAKSRGIAFIGVNSNATEDLPWVKKDAEANFKFPVLIDTGNVLADKLGANVTPEAFYIDAANTLLYHGAIDNDRSGKAITDTYLKTAFDSSLAGKKIEKTRANAFGCSIKRKS